MLREIPAPIYLMACSRPGYRLCHILSAFISPRKNHGTEYRCRGGCFLWRFL